MGGESNKNTKLKCPRGVEVRYWASGKKTLRIFFLYKGVRCREVINLEPTPANIKYADRKRIEILMAIDRGEFNYKEYFPNSKKAAMFCHTNNTNICELLEEYLDEVKRSLRNSTYLGYKRKVDKHLIPMFGKLPVSDLTPAMLRHWIKGLKLTTKTVRNILLPLRAIIITAIADEIIDKNPLDHIFLNKLLDRKTRKSKYVVDPMSREEVQAILHKATGQLKNLFQFAFFSGLRTSELIALEWGDIDWIHKKVRISRTVVEGVEEDETKTLSSTREVFLLPPALDALNAQKAHTFLTGKRIFHDSLTNEPWIWPWQIRERWISVLRQAKVRYRNPYQTRHTYASTLLSNGENMMWVSKQLGHVNTEMVMRTYGRWIPDHSSIAGYQTKNDWSVYLSGVESTAKNEKVG
jgi:integrase